MTSEGVGEQQPVDVGCSGERGSYQADPHVWSSTTHGTQQCMHTTSQLSSLTIRMMFDHRDMTSQQSSLVYLMMGDTCTLSQVIAHVEY